MIDIGGGDGPQDVFEKIESFCGLFWNIGEDDGIRQRCILVVWIRDLSVSAGGG